MTLRVTRAESQAPEGRCALSFQVIDTGRGIPTDEQERIFESFEQGSGVRDSGDQHETGVGLGLAIARNIARRFGGDIFGGKKFIFVPSGGRLGRPAGNARLPLPRFSLPPRPA